MYFLSKFCGICSAKDEILDLSEQDSDGITHIYKLTASLVGMDFEALDVMRFICGECCTTLNTVYRFQQNCLRSKRNLATYVSQLQTFSRVSGSVSVCLRDIRQETEDEDQSAKSQTTLTDTKQEDSQSNVSDHYNFVYIKQEYGSDEDYIVSEGNNFKNNISNDIKEENVNMDYCNEYNLLKFIPKVENEHSDIKHETGNQNVIEKHSNLDEDFIENQHVVSKKEIDIEEHPVSEVKEEALLDSETPAEGPSQEDRSAAAALDTATGSSVDEGRNHRTGIGPYECLQCKKVFETRRQHTRHMHIHSGKRFECEVCKKNYLRKMHLQLHMRTHTGEKPYKCDICEKRFFRSDCLRVHRRSHTGEKPYKCDICGTRFALGRRFKIHMRLHTGERPHQCEICQKNCESKSLLERHIRTHTGEKPYECNVCKNRFHTMGSLTVHMGLHADDELLQCNICKKYYQGKYELRLHKRSHAGERPYKCERCEKTFKVEPHLLKHLQFHPREKPYKCEICKRMLLTSASLAAHMRIHTGEKYADCKICKKTLYHAKSFKVHMQRHEKCIDVPGSV